METVWRSSPRCPVQPEARSATPVMDPGIVWSDAHGNMQIVRPPRPFTCPVPAVPGGPGCAQVAAALYTQQAGSHGGHQHGTLTHQQASSLPGTPQAVLAGLLSHLDAFAGHHSPAI